MMIRVFLVEDDPLVAMMLEGYLDVLGHEIVATAATVAEALDLVAKRDFDLAILDVHLADGKTSEAVASALRRVARRRKASGRTKKKDRGECSRMRKARSGMQSPWRARWQPRPACASRKPRSSGS